jgi:hypothetical protein
LPPFVPGFSGAEELEGEGNFTFFYMLTPLKLKIDHPILLK